MKEEERQVEISSMNHSALTNKHDAALDLICCRVCPGLLFVHAMGSLQSDRTGLNQLHVSVIAYT
jgi:hypothetical protein